MDDFAILMCRDHFEKKWDPWVLGEEVDEAERKLEVLLAKKVLHPHRVMEPRRRPAELVW